MLTNLSVKQGKLCFETEMEQHAICLKSIYTIYVRHATIVIELNEYQEVHILTGLDNGSEFDRFAKLLTRDDGFFMLNKEMIINLSNLNDCFICKEIEFKEFPLDIKYKKVNLIFDYMSQTIYTPKADKLVQDVKLALQEYWQNENHATL